MLHNVAEVFKKVNTETLETETQVISINMFINQLQNNSTLCLQNTDRETEIHYVCEKIRARLHSEDVRNEKTTCTKQRTLNLEKTLTTQQHHVNTANFDLSLQWIIALYHCDQWKKKWESYHQHTISVQRISAQNITLSVKTIWLCNELTKMQSSLATQIRTEKLELKVFLFHCQVPGFDSPACECGWNNQTVKHVLIHCSNQIHLHTELLNDQESLNYCWLSTFFKKLQATTRFMMRMKLLEQFRVMRTFLYDEM